MQDLSQFDEPLKADYPKLKHEYEFIEEDDQLICQPRKYISNFRFVLAVVLGIILIVAGIAVFLHMPKKNDAMALVVAYFVSAILTFMGLAFLCGGPKERFWGLSEKKIADNKIVKYNKQVGKVNFQNIEDDFGIDSIVAIQLMINMVEGSAAARSEVNLIADDGYSIKRYPLAYDQGYYSSRLVKTIAEMLRLDIYRVKRSGAKLIPYSESNS